MQTIPVILDTDIGGDIDDAWALGFLLRCPELDVRGVVTDSGDTRGGARVVGKLLCAAGRQDVPIGIGPATPRRRKFRTTDWAEDFELTGYPGGVHEDGVDFIIRSVMDSDPAPVLICIGPVPNLAEALKREPRIAQRTRIVAMGGVFEKHFYDPVKRPAECNVVTHTDCMQAVWRTAWPITLAPLDVTADMRLTGERYQRLLKSQDPLIRAMVEVYRVFLVNDGREPELHVQSSTLHDCLAVSLVFTEQHLRMRDMPVSVSDSGHTVEAADGRAVRVAMDWLDLPAYLDWMTARLTGSGGG